MVVWSFCTYQINMQMWLSMKIFLSSFRLWYPELALIMVIEYTFVNLVIILFNVGPLCTGHISNWLSLAGSSHEWTKQTQVIKEAVIEATKAAIIVIRVMDNLVNNAKPINAMPRLGNPALRQPIFDWKVANKYQKLCDFEIEVWNIFMTKKYNVQESEKIPAVLHSLGGAQVHVNSEWWTRKMCKSKGLFEVLSDKFMP